MPNQRNSVCHCGSGKKYKKCCLLKDEGFIEKRDVMGNTSWVKDMAKKPPSAVEQLFSKVNEGVKEAQK